MPSHDISLTDVPRLLAQHGVTKSYLQIWNLAIAGTIPATRVGRRWKVAEADIPRIAAIIGAR